MSYHFSYFGITHNQIIEVGDNVLIEVNLNTPFMDMTSEQLWAKVNYVHKDGTCTSTLLSEPCVSSRYLKKGDRIDIGLENILKLEKWKKER